MIFFKTQLQLNIYIQIHLQPQLTVNNQWLKKSKFPNNNFPERTDKIMAARMHTLSSSIYTTVSKSSVHTRREGMNSDLSDSDLVFNQSTWL